MDLFPVPKKLGMLSGFGSGENPVSTIDKALPEEGYCLQITPEGTILSGGSDAGLFYGTRTLEKLRRQYGSQIPAVRIEDAPDFPLRGLLLADAANQETYRELIPHLADCGINQFQIRIREDFFLPQHAKRCRETGIVWLPENLKELDDLCRKHFIKLVPFINSCGHFEVFLERPEYKHLALYPDGGFTFPWGDVPTHGTMLAMNQESFDFVTGIYEQILPYFSSDTVNIGCDETWELGDRFDQYCAFINRLAGWLRERGKKCQIWGDILLMHPNAARKLDPEIIVLVWNYNDGYPFEQNLKALADQGCQVAACPGTSAYLSVCGRSRTARRNVENAARAAHAAHAAGILNTDWQYRIRPWCSAYLPIAHGAAAAWNSFAAEQTDAMATEADFLFYEGKEPELCRWIERFGELSDMLGTKIVIEDRSTLFCLYEHRFSKESIREYGITERVVDCFFLELKRLRDDLEFIIIHTNKGEDARVELRHALDLAEYGGHLACHLLEKPIAGTDALKEKILADEIALWGIHHPAAVLPSALNDLKKKMECLSNV